MEAFPHIQTIKSFVENPADMYPQSLVLDFHNKADGHERRIAAYLVENFRATTGFQVWHTAEVHKIALTSTRLSYI